MRGSILIFLPGSGEINRVCNALQRSPDVGQLVWALPLHGALATQDQRKVFQRPPPGKTKVVVSTNIAETSITIDDVVHVIDSGLHKAASYDSQVLVILD